VNVTLGQAHQIIAIHVIDRNFFFGFLRTQELLAPHFFTFTSPDNVYRAA
jgi:hypothetical protein